MFQIIFSHFALSNIMKAKNKCLVLLRIDDK